VIKLVLLKKGRAFLVPLEPVPKKYKAYRGKGISKGEKEK